MKMKRLLGLLLASAMVLSMLTACGGGTDEPSQGGETTPVSGETGTGGETPAELKVAVVGPMTGDNAQYGMQFERGVAEALAVYNAKGGTQVSYDVFDDKNDAK